MNSESSDSAKTTNSSKTRTAPERPEHETSMEIRPFPMAGPDGVP